MDVTLERELYIQISFSFRGNDQKIILRCTGSGIRSYRSSIFWKGSFCATSLAVVSSKLSGCRNDSLEHLEDDPLELLLQFILPEVILSQQILYNLIAIVLFYVASACKMIANQLYPSRVLFFILKRIILIRVRLQLC